MLRNLLFIATLACLLTGCGKKPETLAIEPYDQKAMDAAIARARTETGEFLRVLAANDGESFSVKAPITEGEAVEHFWLTDVVYRDGVFVGKIGNDPGIVTHVKLGQEWEIKKEEISDWMFIRGERIHGGYTIDPLLEQMPADEAAEMRRRLVR
jgi:uncharacterized protein YegJ (DUF2314 family)